MRRDDGAASFLHPCGGGRMLPAMLNIVSILVGIVALLGALVAFIPLLGAANWLLIPIALVGAGLGWAGLGWARCPAGRAAATSTSSC